MENTYLIFGGNYSNLEATKAVFEKAKELNIAPEKTICTGDMIAYCADAEAVANFMQDWGVNVIQGNCEESVAQDLEDCGCGFSEDTACDLLAKQWYEFCKANLSTEAKTWFASLPKTLEIHDAGLKMLVCHGSPNNINRFVFASTPESKWQELFAETDADIIIAGHCGAPFTKLSANQVWHNAGAVGMPANDGTPRVWYGLMKISENSVSFEHHSLEYDYEEAMKSMQQNQLPKEYATALKTGLWPSLDVLPEAEKSQTGVSLKESVHSWKKPQ